MVGTCSSMRFVCWTVGGKAANLQGGIIKFRCSSSYQCFNSRWKAITKWRCPRCRSWRLQLYYCYQPRYWNINQDANIGDWMVFIYHVHIALLWVCHLCSVLRQRRTGLDMLQVTRGDGWGMVQMIGKIPRTKQHKIQWTILPPYNCKRNNWTYGISETS